MEESEIVSIVVEELAQSVNGINSTDEVVSESLDYYHGRLPLISKRTAKDTSTSRYVSTDVMDAIEATTAEIMPMFADENLALFNPSNQSDVEQAELESNMINYLFINEYDGYTVLQSVIKDALLNRNCTVKVAWDERVEVEYESYDDIPVLAVRHVMQPTADDQNVDLLEQDGDENSYSIKLRRTTLIGKPVVESIPPEQVIVSSDLRTPLTQNARFIAHSIVETVSSLIAQGFDPEIVNRIPAYSEAYSTTSRSKDYTGDMTSAHESTKLVQVYDCYINLDVDGDGIAERRRVILGDTTVLLLNEPTDNIPLIGGCCTMVPHTYQGVSLVDRLSQIQDAKTHITRSIIDGTKLAANQRIAVVSGQVNIDDLLTSVVGGIVRVESPNAVMPLPAPDIPNSSYQLLTMMDSRRSEAGGGAVNTANMVQAISGDSAHAVERTMSAMELTNALLGKTIAETVIRGMFLQLHHIIRKHHTGTVNAKIGGKWVSSTPSEWRKRANLTVQVGASQGERQRRSAVMTKLGTIQAQLAERGSILFDESKLFDCLSDGAKLDGIAHPERYYVDVTSPEGMQIKQEAEQNKQVEQQKQQQMQQQLLKAQQDLSEAELMKGQAALQSQQAKIAVEQAKAESAQQKLTSDNIIAGLKIEIDQGKQELDVAKTSAELAFKYEELDQKTMLKITELELKEGE